MSSALPPPIPPPEGAPPLPPRSNPPIAPPPPPPPLAHAPASLPPAAKLPTGRNVSVGVTPVHVKPTSGNAPPSPRGTATGPWRGTAPQPAAPGRAARPVKDSAPAAEVETQFDPVRAAPPWLVSLVIHLLLLLILGLLTSSLGSGALTVFVSFGEPVQDLGEELSTFDLSAPTDVEQESMESSLEETPIDTSEVMERNIADLVQALEKIPDVSLPMTTAVPAGGITSGRTGVTKDMLLKMYGGTPITEDAVQLGLAWLARQQKADGSWSIRGPYRDGGVLSENFTAATSMAMLAFLGAGNTHESGKYQPQMAKAITWLMKQQDREGNLVKSAPRDQIMYSHAQGTIVLCELFGMTGDSAIRAAAQRAIDYAVDAQSSEGGWRYAPRQDSDTSVTGWYVMAMVSAKSAGLEFPGTVFERAWAFLDSVQYDEGATYGYQPTRPPSPSMTAEGLLSRMYMGWPGDHPSLVLGIETLGDQAPFEFKDKNFYYWYYATQAMHHYGKEPWDRWNLAMREQLPKAQIKSGEEMGSWAPQGSRWGEPVGRLYTTCFAIYCLEVYYRHLPLYNNPWQKKPQ